MAANGNGKAQNWKAPNGIFLAGNLTTDLELQYTSNGKAALSFRVAVNEAGSGEDNTGFFNCQAWGPLAEGLAESLHKGDRVVVAGELRQRSFKGRDEKTHSTIEVVITDAGPSVLWATAQLTKRPRPAQTAPAQTTAPEPVGA